uniref:Fasciculation and elongation protein zeta-2 n=1 Tax=Trichuris muris TaxID=70415 RepID=A0A5S6QVV5_TRIMR
MNELDNVDAPLASGECEYEDEDENENGDVQDSKPETARPKPRFDLDSFHDGFSDSLEDLVSHFDRKITECLKDYKESTNTIAPVQVRTQEEAMNESQIWWTLTGNFGNILPLDWSKSQTRSLQLSALNLLPESKVKKKDAESGTSEEDEDLADSMDLHDMIVSSFSPCDALPQTADQVIEEIDEIMQQSNISEVTGSSDVTMDSVDSMYTPKTATATLINGTITPTLPSVVQAECLSCIGESRESLQLLSYKKLLVVHSELETLIQVFNESLVQELALRDEYEFEKELKNTFISLLLSIQQKRRQWFNECKRRGSKGCKSPCHDDPQPQFLTACIPYREDQGIPDNASFQALIKIMRAINDDSATVPSLLTDYILKVFCPFNATNG